MYLGASLTFKQTVMVMVGGGVGVFLYTNIRVCVCTLMDSCLCVYN